MFVSARLSLSLTALLLGSAAVGCAAPAARGVAAPASASAAPPIACVGGTVHNAAEAAKYARCDAIVGDLSIDGSDFTHLEPFSRLQSISGTLDISDNTQLDNLHGLERLTRLQGLRIEHNGIYDTSGLENLRTVGKLVVKHNSKLISLAGLRTLERASSIEIRNNPRLAGYYGLLPKLQQVDEQLILRHNSGLAEREVHRVLDRVGHGNFTPAFARFPVLDANRAAQSHMRDEE